jgi:hypothetical protein
VYTGFAPYSPFYSISLPPHLLPPTDTNPSAPDAGPVPPSCYWFVKMKWKRKKWHFCLFVIKVDTQGFSLYFHVYMYYNPNWSISFDFLHSVLVPLLW